MSLNDLMITHRLGMKYRLDYTTVINGRANVSSRNSSKRLPKMSSLGDSSLELVAYESFGQRTKILPQ